MIPRSQSCDAYSLAKALVKIMDVRTIVAYLKRKLELLGNTMTCLNLVSWKPCSPRTLPQATGRNQQQSAQNNNLSQMAFLMSLYDLLLA